MSVGSSLQEVRARSGLSIAQLATRTRIPASVIQDLENDNFATSGGPAYARGHIRTIARICNVDVEPILAQFESQTIPLSKSIRDLLNDTNVTKAKPERKPLSWKALSGIAGVVALLVIGGTLITSGNSNSNNSREQTSASSSTSDGAVAKKVNGVSVNLTAVNGLSWVAVSDSTGAERFSGRIRQGESQSFSDNQLIYLVIGNAGAIKLSVNGEDLGIAGKVGEVVRLEFGPQANSKQG